MALLVPASAEAKGALYVSNFGSDDLSAFGFTGNGLPTPFPGSPFAVGDGPSGVAVTPDGSHLYVANRFDLNLHVLGLGATGAPAPIAGSPFPATALDGAAIAPDGRRAYFTNTLSGTIHGFDLAADGSATSMPAWTTGAGPAGLAISPDGRSLYVANTDADGVSAYAIAADGSLSPLPGSPQPAGDGPTGLVVSPDGDRLYATNVYSSGVSAYAIAADGSLSPLPGSPFAGAIGPQGVALTPDGRRLYATSLYYGVYAFDVAADGSLTLLAGSPFADGTPGDHQPLGIAIGPSGKRVYVSNSSTSDLSTFAVAADGSLSALAGSPTPLGGVNAGPFSLATRPDQGPRAALSASPAAGLAARFDAAGSSDPDGAVVAYEWSFGDGTSFRGASPSLVHAYPRPGAYTATVRAIDDEGCSAALVFTGQTAYCNGSPAATATATVTVVAESQPSNGVVGIRIRARKRQRQPRASRGRIVVRLKAGAAEAVRIVARGRIVVAKHGRAKRASVPLEKATRWVPAGKLKKLALRPRTRKGAAKVVAALGRGAKVTARLSLRFTDRAGAQAKRSRAIRLR